MSDFNQTLKINVIVKEKDNLRLSLTVQPDVSVAKLKRLIELELEQIYNVTLLVSTIQDGKGFMLSNNSKVGQHLNHNQTVYVLTHKQKTGSDMNLPNNLTDLFMTLRYVSGSVLKKLLQNQTQFNPLQIFAEIIHLGFWSTNPDVVCQLCRILNRSFTTQSIQSFMINSSDSQKSILLKMLILWMGETPNCLSVYPQVIDQMMALIFKLSQQKQFATLLKNHKLIKTIIEISKDGLASAEIKRMALQIIRQVNGKGTGLGTKISSQYIPSALMDSSTNLFTLDDVLDSLSSNSQENKLSALKQLLANPSLVTQAASRSESYNKLTYIFTIRPPDKVISKAVGQVIQKITIQTSKDRAQQAMQKGLLRKIHAFLLQSGVQAHSSVFQYIKLVASQCSQKGSYSIQEGSQLLNSPYPIFQQINTTALGEMSQRQKKTSPLRFLPHVKDYIRTALKTTQPQVYTPLLKILGNVSLDEQCRYQIINLKGIQVFIKFLQIGQSTQNIQLQRTCAKGLMNLSLSSRQNKAKTLGLMSNILELYYKAQLDPVACSYLENLLKTKN